MEMEKISKIKQEKIKKVCQIYKTIFIKTDIKTSTGILSFVKKGKHFDKFY
jgi:hypothetical protein